MKFSSVEGYREVVNFDISCQWMDTKHTCASACFRCHAGLLLESHDQLLLRGEGAQVHPVGPELGSSCHGGSLLAVVILHLVHGLLGKLPGSIDEKIGCVPVASS